MRHDAFRAAYFRQICNYTYIIKRVNSIPEARYEANIRWQELLVFKDDVVYT